MNYEDYCYSLDKYNSFWYANKSLTMSETFSGTHGYTTWLMKLDFCILMSNLISSYLQMNIFGAIKNTPK